MNVGAIIFLRVKQNASVGGMLDINFLLISYMPIMSEHFISQSDINQSDIQYADVWFKTETSFIVCSVYYVILTVINC